MATFQYEAKFSVWLYRIAFKAAASKWRKKRIDWCDLDSFAELASGSCRPDLYLAAPAHPSHRADRLTTAA